LARRALLLLRGARLLDAQRGEGCAAARPSRRAARLPRARGRRRARAVQAGLRWHQRRARSARPGAARRDRAQVEQVREVAGEGERRRVAARRVALHRLQADGLDVPRDGAVARGEAAAAGRAASPRAAARTPRRGTAAGARAVHRA
jgi:hypothetical protein